MLIMLLTLSMAWKPQPPPVHTLPPPLQWHWYMAKNGHAVHCTGQKRLAYPPLRYVVNGCQGINPVFEIELKD